MSGVSYKMVDETSANERRRTVALELKAMQEEGVPITPDALLERASDESSPLHSYFTWDDTEAAHKWRRREALTLIMASKAMAQLRQSRRGKEADMPKDLGLVRAYVAEGRGRSTFIERREALSHADVRAALIERKRQELAQWCASVVDLPDFAEPRVAAYNWLRRTDPNPDRDRVK